MRGGQELPSVQDSKGEEMKQLYVIRGLPGAGKSTLANLLVNRENVFEADQYFSLLDGVYRFDPTKLGLAHGWVQDCLRGAMQMQRPQLAVANTFSQNWELRPYLRMAQEFGYHVTVLTVESGLGNHELAARNIHGCPVEKIADMRHRWEPYDPQ